MPLYTTEALVLRTYKLAEAHRIVVFLTRDRGKKRGVAHGARGRRSRFGAALEPLTRVRVAYFEKERRELVSVNYAEALNSPLWNDNSAALGHVGYFAELIDEWSPEGDPNETVFRLGAAVLEAIGAGGPIEPLARYFEYWLLRLQGVYPPTVRCHRCGTRFETTTERAAWLGPGDRMFACEHCTTGRDHARGALSYEALAFLRTVGMVGPQHVSDLSVSKKALREVEHVHRALIASHLEKELKSARVLREMRQ
jgi:DNA repair protein RecO (recombination protein O)